MFEIRLHENCMFLLLNRCAKQASNKISYYNGNCTTKKKLGRLPLKKLTQSLAKRSKVLIVIKSKREKDFALKVVTGVHKHTLLLKLPGVLKLQQLKSEQKLEKLKLKCASIKACIAVLQFKDELDLELESYLHFFDKHFDCLLYVRELSNARKMIQLFEGDFILSASRMIEVT